MRTMSLTLWPQVPATAEVPDLELEEFKRAAAAALLANYIDLFSSSLSSTSITRERYDVAETFNQIHQGEEGGDERCKQWGGETRLGSQTKFLPTAEEGEGEGKRRRRSFC